MYNHYKKLIPLVATLSLSACVTPSGNSLFGPEKGLFGDNRVTTASANQLLDKDFESFNDISLIQLLDPDTTGNKSGFDEKYFASLSNYKKTQLMNEAFLTANRGTDTTKAISRRSQIQDHLIAASNQRCNLYGTYLTRLSNFNNGIFGTATTILGSAGAIVTGQQAARVLSGLAGISSGTRAELNETLFENVASSVILPAIEKSRAEIYKEIMNKRKIPIEEYTVEGAVADAVRYHGACNINTGIDFAHKSLQAIDGDIGIIKFNETLAKLGVARNLSLSGDFASMSSLVIASDALKEFSENLKNLKTKTPSTDTNLLTKIGNLESEASNNLLNEANKVDDTLKPILFNYASSKNKDKTGYFNELQAQQISARTFEKKLSNLLESIQLELDKLKQG